MKKGRYGVSGASGALPIWKSVVEGAIDAGLLGDSPAHDSWIAQTDLMQVRIDGNDGMVSLEGNAFAIEEYHQEKPTRYFSPVRMEGNLQEELMDFSSEFAYDEEIDILIPKEN